MKLRAYLELPGHTQQTLAEKLGCSQGLISQHLKWLDAPEVKQPGLTKVSAEWALKYEAVTEGAVTRYDLRPDIFGEAPTKRTRKAA